MLLQPPSNLVRPLCFLAQYVIACTAMATTPTLDSPQIANAMAHLRIEFSGPSPKPAGVYALVENTSNGWAVVKMSEMANISRDNDMQEVMYVRADLGQVQPIFEKVELSRGTLFECNSFGADKVAYTPCNSNLTKAHGAASLFKGIKAVISLGADAGSIRVIDEEAILTLVRQSNLLGNVLEFLRTMAEEKDLRIYRQDFNTIRTIPQHDAFIAKYASNDPDTLVPRVVAHRDDLTSQLVQERARQVSAQAEYANAQAQDRARSVARAIEFRKTLKVETETNCGPVLEMKASLVKVYFPVANFGNEHWIRKEDVFPPNSECKFLNGKYVPPLG